MEVQDTAHENKSSYLCILQKALHDALLQLSSRLRVTAHGDDDLDCVAVIQVSRHWPGSRIVHQNHRDLIRAIRFLHCLSLRSEERGRQRFTK